MSSGTLPLTSYHRAQSLGAGTFGSVVTVYNEDGEEFAFKLFLDDDDDDDIGMSLGALREISALRVFRAANAHPNIIAIQDVQKEFEEDDEEAGAGTSGCLAIAMPLFAQGPLSDNLTTVASRRQKLYVAHGILSAMCHLHAQGMIHRDLKADNILLREANDEDLFEPVVIDFSLAKVIDPSVWYPTIVSSPSSKHQEDEPTHTASIGTPTYRAPEVVNQQPYGLASDMWSVGVILLELLQGKLLEAHKDSVALKLIEEALQKLPADQPFPNLIRGLLETDPTKRWTAQQALESPVFTKFPFPLHERTFAKINLKEALPIEGQEDEDNQENSAGSTNNNGGKNKGGGKNKKNKVDPVLAKRFQTIQKVCDSMEWTHPLTAQAALSYSIQMSQLEDVDDIKESQALLDCCVLAHKFFEKDLVDLTELEEETTSGFFKDWETEQYADNEGTIFMMMDFCLYPRDVLDM
jgi:serine/threonine protein kinase